VSRLIDARAWRRLESDRPVTQLGTSRAAAWLAVTLLLSLVWRPAPAADPDATVNVTPAGVTLLYPTATLPSAAGPTAANTLVLSQAPAAVATASDQLLPGDLLHMDVYDNPDLTIELRVPNDGAMVFPLIGPLTGIKGMTCDGLSHRIAQLLEAKYLTSALVTISIKEYSPRRIYVMGGVAKPGAFDLSPSLNATAARAIGEAGGLVDDADRSNIVVLRTDSAEKSLSLPVTLGNTGADIRDVTLLPNDLIIVSRLDRVYITGRVKSPGSVLSNLPNLTIARALSMVGGFDTFARSSGVHLLRAGQPIKLVDVDAIMSGQAEDLPLQPGDMLIVPARRY